MKLLEYNKVYLPKLKKKYYKGKTLKLLINIKNETVVPTKNILRS